MEIITNNHERQFEYFWDLSEKDKKELDWVTDETVDVFHYRGQVYCIDEFMRVEKNTPKEFQKWDGYLNNTFFSGVLIRYCEDTDYYQIATFY